MRDYVLFFVNGREFRVRGADAFKTLSGFLRYDQGATGTKIVCEEGDCGACSVFVGRRADGRIEYRPVNSCIQFLYQLDCSHVVTVEGLKEEGRLNPVQEAMVRCHGAQCGFCTPGFIVSMCALFEEKESVGEQDIKDALTGNLCRCTGYEPIIKAGLEVDPAAFVKLNSLYPPQAMEAAFREHEKIPVRIEDGGRKYFNPADMESAVSFKAENPGAVIVAGATDVGVLCNKRGFEPPAVLTLSHVPGLLDLKVEDGVMIVGARTSLAALEDFTREHVPELSRILWLFGGPGIKHAGTLAGNIANGSPIADTLPFLFVTSSAVEVVGKGGVRTVEVGSLYKGYKQLDLLPDEIITRVLIPLPRPGERLKLYKVSRRQNLDISAFTAAFIMRKDGGDKIGSIKIAYGGVGPVVLRLPKTEAFLSGREYCLATFEAAGEVAREEISPISDVRGSKDFRYQLAENILVKFFYETSDEREAYACSR